MKLGVSYNLFDGEELLEGSIKCIRSEVDYISVVYQKTSNFGNPCDENLVQLLEKLINDGLVNELIEYNPNLKAGPHDNEIFKRNIGLEFSKKNGCTHHMSMDTDEYYDLEQFKYLKKVMIDGDFDSSYCQLQSYYKSSEYVLDPPENYYVSLIFKIYENSNFNFLGKPPVLVDPTRKMIPNKKEIILNRNQIEMHHMSYVRKNIFSKLNNSSAKELFSDKIKKIVDYYNNWSYPNDVMWSNLQLLKIKKTKDLFNVRF